jgi:uncharacterized membrane protein YfcA
MSGLLIAKSIPLFIWHFSRGNITPVVFQTFLWAMPALVIATVLGFAFEERIDKVQFRRMVLILLLVVGLNTIRGAIF